MARLTSTRRPHRKPGPKSKKPAVPLLTPLQSQIWQFIKTRCESGVGSPSYREIQEHFGFKAIGTVQDHVKALLKKGALERVDDGRRARGLLPVEHDGSRAPGWSLGAKRAAEAEGVKRIPVMGEIAAGSTRDTPQIELGSLVVSESTVKDPCFALRVVGDSMIDVGILEGDFVIVEKRSRARSGDIVVALLNGETTVKRYVERDGKIFLVPENARLAPIPVVSGSFEIQGKVVGLQRRF